MNAIETLTDAGGYERTVYTDGSEPRSGQSVAKIQAGARGFHVTLGFFDRNQWNGLLETRVMSGKSYKTRKGAETAARNHLTA